MNIYIILEIIWTIRTFGGDVYEGKISLQETDKDHLSLLDEIRNFRHKAGPQNDKKKQ